MVVVEASRWRSDTDIQSMNAGCIGEETLDEETREQFENELNEHYRKTI